ncbi:putative ABC transporter permease (plasmid) [Allorhizobium sp. Av2]|nr:hypothetical protein [Allorhizobium sp. Av2]
MARKNKNDNGDEPKNPLRHLRPRLVPFRLHPFKQQVRNVAEQASFLSKLKSSIDAEEHICPKCDARMVFKAQEGEGAASLVCTSCDHSELLSINPIEAMERSHRFMDQSNQMFYVGLGAAVLASLISMWNGSVFTFLGGILLGSILWVQSAGMRYRAWQYSNMRVYERKSPFKEWLRSELPFFKNRSA